MVMSYADRAKLSREKTRITVARKKEERKQKYEENPLRCRLCDKIISYEKYTSVRKREREKGLFCNRSCSAKYNNTKRKCLNNCLVCNEAIYKNRKFCSRECNGNYLKQISYNKFVNGEKIDIANIRRIMKTKNKECMSPNCLWDFSKIPVTLEIHHIDGNSENNLMENLVLLCPNCHSLTETYKAKNIGNGRHYRRERYKEGKNF